MSDSAVGAGGFNVRGPLPITEWDRVALAVSTSCGVGYMPVVPATWGSLVGVGIYILLRAASANAFALAEVYGLGVPARETFHVAFMIAVLVPVTAAGVWAASRAERVLGGKDPRPVVIDEIVGQLITLLLVPLDAGLWALGVGFVVFRLFDIWKPYPARRLENLRAGLGIMADDVMAGAYGAILMLLLAKVY